MPELDDLLGCTDRLERRARLAITEGRESGRKEWDDRRRDQLEPVGNTEIAVL